MERVRVGRVRVGVGTRGESGGVGTGGESEGGDAYRWRE